MPRPRHTEARNCYLEVKIVSNIEQVPASERAEWVATHKALEIDVREPNEWAVGTIDGITKISMNDVPARIDELDKDVAILVVCRSGARSQKVAEFLASHGYTAANLAGGMIGVADELSPGDPFDPLHHYHWELLGVESEDMDRHDIRMLELTHQPGLVQQAYHGGLADPIRSEAFERYLSLQRAL